MYRKILAGGAAALACVLLIVSVTQNWDLIRSLGDRRGDQFAGFGAPNPGGVPIAFFDQFNTDNLTIARDEILAGGPPKDGIPAITDPQVTAVAEVDFLQADDRVVGVTLDDHARAYPIRLLNWHEAVNDQLGDTSFAVIYCPLCD